MRRRPEVQRIISCGFAVLLAAPIAPVAAAATGKLAEAEAGRHFDLRSLEPGAAAPAASPAQAAAIARWRAAFPELALERDARTGAVRTLANLGGYLGAASVGGDVEEMALAFVRGELDLLGLTSGDLDDLEVTSFVPSRTSGLYHLYLRQRHAGIPVYNGQLQVNLRGDGRVLSLHNQFLPDLARAANRTEPAIGVAAAVGSVASHLGARAEGLVAHADTARLMYLPIRAGEARLVWNFQVETADRQHWYDVTVDAEDGRVWTRYDWVAADQYKVYPLPVESPNHTTPAPPGDGRATVVDPATVTASPFGWHDTDGAAGAEFTTTQGNNVHAYTDTDANNTPDPGSSPDGTASLDFSFALDLTQPPSAYRPAAVANLFYWNNIQHDVLYQYGFDEPAGNFQQNNYGNGGTGADYVLAEAQDGSGTNNANFATPADGSKPRMQMYVWTAPTPDKDGDLDAGIVLHEYGHGVSNRLTGGPANVGCLGNSEQMGEGWSDWMTVWFTALPGHAATTPRGVGTYALDQPVTGPGIRPAPYTTDFAVNNYTYGNLPSMAVPHGVGFVWNTMLWEMYWELVAAHGFNPDLYEDWTTGGNNLAMQLVIDGMKLQPCSPGFVDGRNAILQADTNLTGGANQCRIWKAFARRGLGFSASQGSSTSAADGTAAFDIPVACDFLGATTTDQAICVGTPAVYNITLGGAWTPPVTMAATGHPAGTTAIFGPNPVGAVPGATTLTIGNTVVAAAGSYPITVTGNGDGAHPLDLTLDVVTGAPAVATLAVPGEMTTVGSARPNFQWNAAAGAAEYQIEVDDDPGFGSLAYSATVAGTSHVPTSDLPLDTLLYWRVRASNACGAGGNSAVRRFAVAAPISYCQTTGLAIPDANTTGVNSQLTIPAGAGIVTDIDVDLVATHTWVGDLKFTLSNGTTTVAFYDRPGYTGSGFGCNGDNVDVLVNDEGPDGSVESQCSNLPATSGNRVGGDPASASLLAAFDGQSLTGTWTLNASDNASGDTGTVNSWCVVVPNAMPFLDGFETGNTSRWSLTATP